MELKRKATDFGDGPEPDDWTIKDGDRKIGRIYKAVNVAHDPWVWFINGEGLKADKGAAASLDEALGAFKRALERQ